MKKGWCLKKLKNKSKIRTKILLKDNLTGMKLRHTLKRKFTIQRKIYKANIKKKIDEENICLHMKF